MAQEVAGRIVPVDAAQGRGRAGARQAYLIDRTGGVQTSNQVAATLPVAVHRPGHLT
jgi:hypothetical protein